jgi:hypothetical protein
VAGWEAAMDGRRSAWRRGSRRLGLVVEAAGVVAGMKKKEVAGWEEEEEEEEV